jgi:hypothetical protein
MMAIKADEVVHPDEIDDEFDWESVSEADHVDAGTKRTLNLASRAVQKFPEMSGKYKAYAGAAAVVSSTATLIAAVAISRKMKRGGISAEKALASLTSADLESAVQVAARDQRYKRLLRRLKLKRGKKAE